MTLTSLSFICSIIAAVISAVLIFTKQGGGLLGPLGSLLQPGSKGPGLGLISELFKFVPGGKSPDPLGIIKSLLPMLGGLKK